MNQQLALGIFQRHYQRGLAAYRSGDTARARELFLRAARTLYKLAAASYGELRTTRMERAAKLVALAKSIDPNAPPPARGEPVPVAAGGKAGGAKAGGEQWIVAVAPDVRMDDVVGLADVKAVIRKRVIYPFQHPEITAKYRKQAGGGLLLYGPPGTGKTMIAKAIAAEVDATFFSVKCSDIISKWVGEAERNLQRLFEAARQHERAVVFMDETEAIVAKRGGYSTVMNRVIPEFLAQVDGLQGRHTGLLLLGATNRPWDMDEAALRHGRFGELIYVPLPDLPARRKIVASALEGLPLAADIDIDAVAAHTEGYSGADLVGLCEVAKDAPYEREITSGVAQCLEVADIDAALAGSTPSVAAKMLSRYQTFRREG